MVSMNPDDSLSEEVDDHIARLLIDDLPVQPIQQPILQPVQQPAGENSIELQVNNLQQNPVSRLIQNIPIQPNGNISDPAPEPGSLQFENRKLSAALIYKESEWRRRFGSIPGNLKLIYDKLIKLTEKMREENSEHYQDFENRLYTAIRNASPQRPEKWLFRAFNDLVSRVGAKPSWRAVASIVNCIHLVHVVSSDYNRKYTRVDSEYLQSKMQEFLENFLNEKYTDFINEMGGWEDFLDYYDAVSKNRDAEKPEPGIWEAVLPAAAIAGLGMFVLNSFR